MNIYTAAIAARHKLTRRYAIKAGSVLAENDRAAQELALKASLNTYAPSLYDDHQANVQRVPQTMLDDHARADLGIRGGIHR